MNELRITRGLPGSGKSTYARQWVTSDPDNRVRVERDEIRFSMFGRGVLSGDEELLVTEIQVSIVKAALAARKSVIVSDTNLAAEYVKRWMQVAKDCGVLFSVEDIDTSLETCLKQNKGRGEREVPEEVIRRMYARYFVRGHLPTLPILSLKVESSRVYNPDTTLPPAFIFDVDGTTQINTSGRGFFEWHRVGEDTPNAPVIDVARRLAASGAAIVVVSGRDEVCRPETSRNLLEHGMPVDALFMRPRGSMDKDSLVKERILFNDIAPRWNVLGTFDDRNQVVDFWRNIGLTCYQVAEGNF